MFSAAVKYFSMASSFCCRMVYIFWTVFTSLIWLHRIPQSFWNGARGMDSGNWIILQHIHWISSLQIWRRTFPALGLGCIASEYMKRHLKALNFHTEWVNTRKYRTPVETWSSSRGLKRGACYNGWAKQPASNFFILSFNQPRKPCNSSKGV